MLPQAPDPGDPKLARPPQNKKNETVRLQSEIAAEIGRDAPHIARMVFGDAKDHPDVVGVPNASLDQVYHQKFLAQDRQWLQAEARRDPEQFLKVTERIGVRMPDPNAPPPVAPPLPLPAPPPVAQVPMMLPAPPVPIVPPVAPPGPVVVPSIPAPMQAGAPSPVILGPNGQPLPPSVPAMAQGGVVTQPTLALIGEAGPEAVVPLGPQPGDALMQAASIQPPPPPLPPPTPQESLASIGQGIGPQKYVPPIADYKDPITPHWGIEGINGGTDMWAPPGTPIQAMHGGQVQFAGYDATGGNAVQILGEDGRVYYYAHMQKQPLVKAGDVVPAGTQLGTLGDTGDAKGKPHLHLGVGQHILLGADEKGGTGTDNDLVAQLKQVYGQA